MIILGHPFFETTSLYKIKTFEQIKNTPSNSTVLLDFGQNDIIELIKTIQMNNVSFAFVVHSIKELIFANNFEAKFVVVDRTLAQNAQKIANEYLFDTKVLVLIENEIEIEKYALEGIDGVIFQNAIK